MKASDLMVKALENEGVEYIFGIPGEENLDFINSLKDSSIQLILTRHEQAAGFMAATYGRLTGKPGVCLSTLGPGATNFVTAAAYAQLGAMPLVMLSGQKPLRKRKQGRFQIVDLVEMMRPLTKSARQVVDANSIPALVRDSFRIAKEEMPGPVYIELPEDIAEDDAVTTVFDVIESYHPDAPGREIERAVKMIESAKYPLLLIGASANRACAGEALARFVDQTGIYFFATQMGKGVLDERHPRFLGTAALSDNDFIHCAIDRADLIINVGHDIIEKPPFFMEKGGKKVIHINFFASHIDDVYFPQLNVIGDISTSIERITERIELDPEKEVNYFSVVKEQIDDHLTKYFKDDRFPLLPQRLVSLLRDALAPEDVITLDNGVYKIWFARNYKCYQPNTLLLDNALATMGAGLASAIAVKHLYPDRKVVSVSGDGGFMMNSQELETAIRLKLDLVVIILNDSAYGMIKWKQEGMGFEDYGLDFGNPDFVRYAESFGATGHRPNSAEDFKNILEQSLQGKGVHVIDLPVDYSLNHPILHVLLKESSCQLLS
jgi:acetolactate synthase-1/2/3 large subunit